MEDASGLDGGAVDGLVLFLFPNNFPCFFSRQIVKREEEALTDG